MAEDEEKIESDKSPEADAESSAEDFISLDDIDSIISESDPEFENEINEIKKGSAEIEIPESDEDLGVSDETESMLEFSDKYPRLYRMLRPIRIVLAPFSILKRPYLFIQQKLIIIKIRLKNKIYIIFKNLINFFKQTVPNLFKSLFKKTVQFFKSISDAFVTFIKTPLKTKLLALLFLVLFVITGVFTVKSTKGIWLPFLKVDFATDLISMGDNVTTVEQKYEDWRYLHEVFPQPEYTVMLKKIVANLRRENPRLNPMVAIQMYLNVNSKEVAVEVKDRENQLRDVIQRVIEGLGYSELQSELGLLKMKELIRQDVNQTLNLGHVKSIYIKLIVTIPNAG